RPCRASSERWFSSSGVPRRGAPASRRGHPGRASMTTTTAGPGRKAPGARPKRDVQGSGRLAAILLSPTLIVLALVVAYPLISALRDSLYQKNQGLDANGFVVNGDKFVGLKNYTAIFSGDAGHEFWNAFWNTTFFTVTTIVIETILGVAMALVMHRAFKG